MDFVEYTKDCLSILDGQGVPFFGKSGQDESDCEPHVYTLLKTDMIYEGMIMRGLP